MLRITLPSRVLQRICDDVFQGEVLAKGAARGFRVDVVDLWLPSKVLLQVQGGRRRVQEVILEQLGKNGMVCVACLVQRVATLAGGVGWTRSRSAQLGEKQAAPNSLKRETTRNSQGSAPNVEGNMAAGILLQRVTMGEWAMRRGKAHVKERRRTTFPRIPKTSDREREACALQ